MRIICEGFSIKYLRHSEPYWRILLLEYSIAVLHGSAQREIPFLGRLREHPRWMSSVRMQRDRVQIGRVRRRLRAVRLPSGHPRPDLPRVQAGVLRILQQGMPE